MTIELTNMAEVSTRTATDGTRVRVLEFPALKGSDDPALAQTLFFAQQAGMTAKIVEITLNNGQCVLEPGALYFMKGDLELTTNSGGGGILGGITRAMLSGETVFLNTIKGTGTIFLEPTFGHLILHEIKADEQAVIADRGSFHAATGGIKVASTRVRTFSGAILGGEGLFQSRIEGRGIAILTSPVPESEITKVKLDGDTLHVDGNFALMRSAGVGFEVRKSSKSWIGSAVSGEGFLNVYTGKGRVWLAPTQGIYQRLHRFGLSSPNVNGSAPDGQNASSAR